MSIDTKMDASHVEEQSFEDQDLKLQVTKSRVATSGTVQLTAGKIVYIPAPTADPRGTTSSLSHIIIVCNHAGSGG